MEIPRRRHLNDIGLGLFLLSHPARLLCISSPSRYSRCWPRESWGIFALIVGAHAAMQISIAMLTACEMGVFDALNGQPLPLDALAQRLECQPQGLSLLLNLLISCWLPALSLWPLPQQSYGAALVEGQKSVKLITWVTRAA